MFWDSYWKKSVDVAIQRAVDEALKQAALNVHDSIGAAKSIRELKEQISQLEIDKAKKLEEFTRREREVEHKVGLERKRQEFEIAQSKRETEVKVREENLAADKERFKDEMDFQRKHLEGEIGSLRDLVGEMLKRLPSAEIYATVKKRG